MGLDQYLIREYFDSEETVQDSVGYWRKANQIHNWFEKKCSEHGELDDCEKAYVSYHDLEELLNTCIYLIDLVDKDFDFNKVKEFAATTEWIVEIDSKISEINTAVFDEMMPCSQGFFFGSYDYDAYYILQIIETYEIVRDVLANFDYNAKYYYYGWW